MIGLTEERERKALSRLGRELEDRPEHQDIFLRVLLPYLRRHGASTVADLTDAAIELFGLRLEPEEVLDLLECARLHGLVEPLEQFKDAYGNPIKGTVWIATATGLRLRRPRSLTIRSFRELIAEFSPANDALVLGMQVLVMAVTFLPFLIALFQSALSPGRAQTAVELLASLLLVIVVVGFSLWWVGENAAQRQAAKVWARLAESRPRVYGWLVSPIRPWVALLAPVLVILPVVISVFANGSGLVPLCLYATGWSIFALMYVWHQRTHRRPPTGPPEAG
jgi:hypothetical protein